MELTEKIIELLANSEPMRPGEIAQSLEVDKKELDKALKILKDSEKIISPKRCFYSIKK